MKLWGVLLLCLGGLGAGMSVSGKARKRIEELGELAQTMALAAQLLEGFALPTGELLRQLAVLAPGCGAELFGQMQRKMESGDETLLSLWTECVRSYEGQERGILLAFGRRLGQCSATEQAGTARLCGEELRTLAGRLQADYEREKRLPAALGAAAGALVSLLIL